MKTTNYLIALLSLFILAGLPVSSNAAKPETVDTPPGAVYHEASKTWYFYTADKLTVLYQNKMKKAEGTLLQGKRTGKWSFYYPNGNLKGTGTYDKGTMTGYWKLYYSDGTLRFEGNYKNSLKDGEWTFYYESGAKKSVGYFVAGVKHGPWTEYYSNNQIFYKGAYKYGRADGNWIYYFQTGKLYQSGMYVDDRKEGDWTICIYPDEPCQVQNIVKTAVPKTSGLPQAEGPGDPSNLKDDAESILKSMDDGKSESGGWGD